MREFLLSLLDCPACRSGELGLKGAVYSNGEVFSGKLNCKCGKVYPVINGIPRFVEKKDRTQVRKRFEYQWGRWGRDPVIFGRNKKEEIEDFFNKFTGSQINPPSLRGKITLDAGCGHGRYAQIMAECGAFSVGMDLGEAVEIARENILNFPNASIVQGDIMNLPFKNGVFDYVNSNGVIHHTPNTRRAFSNLAAKVKKGGFLDIWVYPKKNFIWEIMQEAVRSITTRLPAAVLAPLCYAAVPLLSFVPTFSNTRFPKNSWRECAQVIFDWYAPEYQTHHTDDEISGWYQAEGFEDIEILKVPVAVSGKKR